MPRTLTLGAICDPISTQLAGIISKEDGEQLDRDNDAINRCYLQGFMPDAVTARARKKLMAKCQAAVTKYSEANGADEQRRGHNNAN